MLKNQEEEGEEEIFQKTKHLISYQIIRFVTFFLSVLYFYETRERILIPNFFCLFHKNKQIKWVEQQHILERDKRNVVPEYIPTVHPEAYIIRDPLFSQQWYLVSVFLKLFLIFNISLHSLNEFFFKILFFRTILVNQTDPQNLILIFFQFGVVEFLEKML